MQKKKLLGGIAIVVLLILVISPEFRTNTLFSISLLLHEAELKSADIHRVYSDSCIKNCLPTTETEVLWGDQQGKIYTLNLSTGKKSIFDSQTPDIRFVDKDRGKLVWATSKSIYIKDVTGNREIVTSTQKIFDMKLYADKIIFLVNEDAEPDSNFYSDRDPFSIYLYDLTTKTKKQVTHRKEGLPCINLYRDILIYTESENIYIYNLTKDEVTGTITPEPQWYWDGIHCPSIYKNKVAYEKNWNLYLYDILGGKKNRLTEVEPVFENDRGAITYLRLNEDELKYTQRTIVDFFDMRDRVLTKCTQFNITTKKKKDISCSGGIGSD